MVVKQSAFEKDVQGMLASMEKVRGAKRRKQAKELAADFTDKHEDALGDDADGFYEVLERLLLAKKDALPALIAKAEAEFDRIIGEKEPAPKKPAPKKKVTRKTSAAKALTANEEREVIVDRQLAEQASMSAEVRKHLAEHARRVRSDAHEAEPGDAASVNMVRRMVLSQKHMSVNQCILTYIAATNTVTAEVPVGLLHFYSDLLLENGIAKKVAAHSMERAKELLRKAEEKGMIEREVIVPW